MIDSSRLQRIAEIVMVLGIVALCQPWSMFLHRYGVAIILVGLVTFMMTNWFGKTQAQRDAEVEGVFDVSDHHDGLAKDGHAHETLVQNRQTGSRP
jgi:hypothetical protein